LWLGLESDLAIIDIANLRNSHPGLRFELDQRSNVVTVLVDDKTDFDAIGNLDFDYQINIQGLIFENDEWGKVVKDNLVGVHLVGCEFPGNIFDFSSSKLRRIALDRCNARTHIIYNGTSVTDLLVTEMTYTSVRELLDNGCKSAREIRLTAIESESPLTIEIGAFVQVLQISAMKHAICNFAFVDETQDLSLVELYDLTISTGDVIKFLSRKRLSILHLDDCAIVRDSSGYAQNALDCTPKIVVRLTDDNFTLLGEILAGHCQITRL